jgi:outer membrane lipoprotein-sorting protein
MRGWAMEKDCEARLGTFGACERAHGVGSTSAVSRRLLLLGVIALVSWRSAEVERAVADTVEPKALWTRSIEAQRLAAVRGYAILRTLKAAGSGDELRIGFVAKLGDDGSGRLLMSRIESEGPLHGSRFLTTGSKEGIPAQWLYMPAMRAPRRVVRSHMNSSYFGSEFTYADFLEPLVSDFNVRLLGEDTIGATPCWKLEAIPNEASNGKSHGKRVLWLRQDNAVERRIVYYDSEGAALRAIDVRGVIEIGGNGKWFALKRTAYNFTSGMKSIATFHDLETEFDIDDQAFSPQHLSSEF